MNPPETETVFQGRHVEAVPRGKKGYVVVHRGTNERVFPGVIPKRVAKLIVEALETGFLMGASAADNHLKELIGKKGASQSITGADLRPHTITRPA